MLSENNHNCRRPRQDDNMDNVQPQKAKESSDRVWENLEKLLDRFAQDQLKNKEELKSMTEYSRGKN